MTKKLNRIFNKLEKSRFQKTFFLSVRKCNTEAKQTSQHIVICQLRSHINSTYQISYETFQTMIGYMINSSKLYHRMSIKSSFEKNYENYLSVCRTETSDKPIMSFPITLFYSSIYLKFYNAKMNKCPPTISHSKFRHIKLPLRATYTSLILLRICISLLSLQKGH